MFLPAASYCYSGTVSVQFVDYGDYWSSTAKDNLAYYLDFYSGRQKVYSGSRSYGYSVRAVLAEE